MDAVVAVAIRRAADSGSFEVRMLRFAEELVLLTLDKESGAQRSVPGRSMRCALAGSVLMDLALEDRIDTDTERLFLVDATPIGDGLLNRSLAMIAESDKTRPTAYWIERLAEPAIADEVRRRALDRLVRRGILEREAGGDLFTVARRVVRSRRYPAIDGAAGREVELRIMGVLFSEVVPDPRDVMLICLVDACGIFDWLLSSREQAEARERIDLIGMMDAIGRSVFAAIREAGVPDTEAAPARPRVDATAPPPLATGGLPFLGNVLQMKGNLTAHMMRQYRELGPAFRMQVPWGTYTVLAGLEANLFCQTKGSLHLRGFDTYLGLARELDAHRFVLSMDGREHFRLRKVLRDGYSRASLESRIDQAGELAVRAVDQLPEGQAVPAMPFMQRLVSSQLGELLAGISPGEYFDDLVFYFDRVIAVRLLRRLPGLMMRTPRMRRASKRVHELFSLVMDAHAPERREGKEPDLVDDVLAMHRADPQFLPESELKSACLGPLIAGLHTVASVSACMLYSLLKHQDLMAKTRDEAHKLFADGGPTAAKLRAMDVTHRVAMETLRMYHIAPAVPRTVVNGFEFAGYWIPAGTALLIATAVTHVCAEHFPDPHRFDIDRYLPERAEHRKPGAYAPFGLGTHRCLGGAFAESQIALNIAAILHRAEIVMHPPDHELQMDYSVIPAPKSRFKFSVASRL